MPTILGLTGQNGVPGAFRTIPIVRSAENGVTPFFEYPYDITGVTRDSVGAPLAGVTVQLFRTADDSYVSETTSDASGAFSIPASQLFSHYLVCYKAGSPDVSGTTVNTLVGS